MAALIGTIALKNRSPISSLDVSPDGSLMVVAQSGAEGEPTASLWNTGDLRMVTVLARGDRDSCSAARFASNGRRVAYTAFSSPMIHDLELQTSEARPIGDTKVYWLKYAAKADRVLAAGRRTQVFSGDLKELIWELPDPGQTYERGRGGILAALSPDGNIVAAPDPVLGRMRLFNIEDSSKDVDLGEGQKEVRYVSFDPVGRYVGAIGKFSSGILVWDSRTSEPVLPKLFNAKERGYYSMAFHPEGAHVVLGTVAGWVVVFRLSDGEAVLSERIHSGRIYDVAFSPDGRRVYSGGEDAVINILEMPG